MMKTIKKIAFLSIIGLLASCKSNYTATDILKSEDNKKAIYKEIISNPNELSNFIALAREDEEAKKVLMKAHMQQMESGGMKMMMEKNPEMKEKMQSHMQKMMDENPEMMKKMQTKILDKMMSSEKGREVLLEKIHNNELMKKEMKKKMNK